MSKQVQHFLYLFGVFYAELINQAGAALLGNYGTANAAAGIQLLCQLGNALVFGLQNHAAVIKILAKAGNRVSCCGNTAAAHNFAVQYLAFNVLGKLTFGVHTLFIGRFGMYQAVRRASRCCTLGW